MTYTRSFEGYTPPKRYDDLPFTTALIRESDEETGTYATVETIVLSPVDADPANPATRNFTTDEAVIENGWYVIRWVDAASSIFDSDPILYSASGPSTVITAADIRDWSNVDFGAMSYPAPTSGTDRLQRLVSRAIEYVLDVTGIGAPENVPTGLTETWEEAVQRRTEQLVFKAQEDEAETGAGFDLTKSFGAGSYNETSRDMGDVEKGKQINPWPVLNDLLWRLATEDKRDEWRERWGAITPAFAVSEVDWAGSLLPPSESQSGF